MKKIINNIKKNISEIIENNYLVIVEGKKDKTALNNIGIKNIKSLENKPLFEFVEEITEKNVVILTDLDAEGKKLFNKIRYELQRKGIKLHNEIRNNLFKIKLSNIEGLDNYLDHLLFI